MKYIFDFDDVLFHTTKNLKERLYAIYKRHGLSQKQLQEYYEREKKSGFSLRKLIRHFSLGDEVYEEAMSENQKFINQQVLDFAKSIGKENCFIISAGNQEFQRDKIKRAGIGDFFQEIIVTLGSKKEAVEKICEDFKNEKIFFIDDKEGFFRDLDFKKYSNLKTILYTGQKLDVHDFSG